MEAEKRSNNVFSKKIKKVQPKNSLSGFCWTGCTDLGAPWKTLLEDSPFSWIPQQSFHSLSPGRLQWCCSVQWPYRSCQDPSAGVGLWGGGASPADWWGTSALLVKMSVFLHCRPRGEQHPIPFLLTPSEVGVHGTGAHLARIFSAWSSTAHWCLHWHSSRRKHSFPHENAPRGVGKAQRNTWVSLYQRAEASAAVLGENGAGVGIVFHVLEGNFLPEQAGCCKRYLRLLWAPGEWREQVELVEAEVSSKEGRRGFIFLLILLCQSTRAIQPHLPLVTLAELS